MRPDNKYDRIRRVESSRARVHLTADLGWLGGFPVGQVPKGIVWRQCTPDQSPLGTEILVDREKIRRAEYTLNKIEHEYSKVLADVVREPDQWAERVHRLLDRLKAAIHSKEPLPARLPETMDAQHVSVRNMRRKLLRQHPALEPLDDAFSWRLYLEPTAVRSTMVWLTSTARDVLGLLTNDQVLRLEEKWAWAMSLWRMADQHGAERTARLIRYLGEPRLSKTPFAKDEYVPFLRLWTHRLSRFQPGQQPDPIPEPPSTTLADQFQRVAIWIAQQPKATQAQALDLFNLLVDDTLLDAWHTFADRVGAAIALARRMTGVSTAGQFEPRATKTHAAFFNDLAQKELPDARLQDLPGTLEALCTPAMRLVREEVLRTLPCISLDSGAGRARQDFCDTVVARSSYLPGPRVATALRLFRQYLAGGDAPKLLAPWLGGRYRFAAIFTAGDNGPRHARSFFAALRSLIEQDTPLRAQDVENVESLADELPDVESVIACFVALKAAGIGNQSVASESIRCAYRLRSHGVDFGACVVDLETMVSESSTPVIRIVDALHATGQIGIAAHLVRQGEYGLLIAAGRRLEVLRGLVDLGQAPIVAAVEQPALEWIHRYPLALHEALTRLAAVTTDAEPVAQRVLAKDLPPPEAIASEIAALQDLLRTRPGNTRLESRLTNLQARQSSASTISPARLDNLRMRLELNTSRLWIENWLRQMEEQGHAKLHTLLGSANLPDWVWNEANLRLVSAISKLEGRVRELGLQLIRRRCGPPPWDFHAEPANQEFLALLRERGVDPRPLVDPPAYISIEDAKGRRYQFGFERDPLEVLRMGEPFDTCLSPDGCNFFSAIVNAVDINKRVIYARDTEGKIVGRCLLAVTDLGRLLTFRIYSNIRELDLQAAVSQFVATLARSMGTYVAKRGTVPTLVAPKWYDDGPQDLGTQFVFLAPGSPFRVALATLPLPDLLPAIRAAFAPLPPDDMMLALVLELEEFDQRPELILPLIPWLESAQHLPETLRWRAAARAHKAGRSDFAARVLNGRKLTRIVQTIERHGVCPCCSEPALRTLVELDPTTVLRALRLTRGKSVRSDEAEYDGQRRHLLATAHSRLGRDALAGRLRRAKTDSA
jgi:hypothetical protein